MINLRYSRQIEVGINVIACNVMLICFPVEGKSNFMFLHGVDSTLISLGPVLRISCPKINAFIESFVLILRADLNKIMGLTFQSRLRLHG